MSTTSSDKTDYVGPARNSNVVYVIVGDRAKFDQIKRPVTTHDPLPDGRRVLSKTIGNWSMQSDEGIVIFQHWLDEEPTQQKANDK